VPQITEELLAAGRIGGRQDGGEGLPAPRSELQAAQRCPSGIPPDDRGLDIEHDDERREALVCTEIGRGHRTASARAPADQRRAETRKCSAARAEPHGTLLAPASA